MSYEPEFVRERRICQVLGARGARDAREGLPEDPDPLSDDDLVDLDSFYLSDPEFLVELFLESYRAAYGSVQSRWGSP